MCVECFECESFLVLKDKDIDGNLFFDSGDVECYKMLVECLGGI